MLGVKRNTLSSQKGDPMQPSEETREIVLVDLLLTQAELDPTTQQMLAETFYSICIVKIISLYIHPVLKIKADICLKAKTEAA